MAMAKAMEVPPVIAALPVRRRPERQPLVVTNTLTMRLHRLPIPRILPHRLHRPLHKLVHEKTGWSWGPWGYFGCRVCDREWLEEHPEDAEIFDDGDAQD